jgi:hypothetical protein
LTIRQQKHAVRGRRGSARVDDLAGQLVLDLDAGVLPENGGGLVRDRLKLRLWSARVLMISSASVLPTAVTRRVSKRGPLRVVGGLRRPP